MAASRNGHALIAATFPTVPSASQSKERVHGLSVEELDALKTHSLAARDLAYCPYSKFRVGATLLTKSNVLISGANYENASSPVGTCAERCALGTALVSGGCKPRDFRAIGVATDLVGTDKDDRGFCSPCGMCRQALKEYCDDEMPVFMHDRHGQYRVKTVEELLPMSFGRDTLEANP